MTAGKRKQCKGVRILARGPLDLGGLLYGDRLNLKAVWQPLWLLLYEEFNVK